MIFRKLFVTNAALQWLLKLAKEDVSLDAHDTLIARTQSHCQKMVRKKRKSRKLQRELPAIFVENQWSFVIANTGNSTAVLIIQNAKELSRFRAMWNVRNAKKGIWTNAIAQNQKRNSGAARIILNATIWLTTSQSIRNVLIAIITI